MYALNFEYLMSKLTVFRDELKIQFVVTLITSKIRSSFYKNHHLKVFRCHLNW